MAYRVAKNCELCGAKLETPISVDDIDGLFVAGNCCFPKGAPFREHRKDMRINLDLTLEKAERLIRALLESSNGE